MTANKYFPIMGKDYQSKDYAQLNLHVDNQELYKSKKPIRYPELERFIATEKIKHNVKFLYGGYLEHRGIYVSDHFEKDERNIHLGVDIWATSGKAIFAPCDLRVHSTAYNNNPLDYGHTIIFECLDESLYLLIGHLSAQSLEGKYEGRIFEKGTICAHIGQAKDNGGWVPHLHLQAIKNISNHWGDYPGVCHADDLEMYAKNCPDPTPFII